MYRYIISRILLVFPTLIGAAALVFLLMRLVPGDICLVRLGSGGTSFTQAALATCHAEIGIDRPWIVQFLDFLWGLARLDFGKSMVREAGRHGDRDPVPDLARGRDPGDGHRRLDRNPARHDLGSEAEHLD